MPETKWRSPRWDALPFSRKIALMVAVSVQISLAVAAWSDLAERPASQVRGPKRKWAAIIAINFVGPLWYFARGRVTAPPQELADAASEAAPTR